MILKKLVNPVKIFLVLSVAAGFSSCFFSPEAKLVTPVIRVIGLPDLSSVGSVTLKVTGPDMDPVEVMYSQLPSVINISVPEGTEREFELTVGLTPAFIAASSDAATSYKGTATADITSDSAVVELTMGVGSTKIVVPDMQWGAGATPRVLQFDNIDDTSGVPLTKTQLVAFDGTWSSQAFQPVDVDFDSQGRIYIANNDNISSYTKRGILRIDNITGTNPQMVILATDTVLALAVDRENNVVYYNSGGYVWKCDTDGSNNQELNSGSVLAEVVTGLAVADGFLYVADSSTPQIIKYDLDAGVVVKTVDNTDINQLNDVWDVIVKGDRLYVANSSAEGDNPPAGYQVLELSTTDLNLTGSFGDFVNTANTAAGKFYGPRRFVAPLNDGLTIMDDYDSNSNNSNNFDKIIRMDNINGDNWTTLPGTGDGQTFFEFLYHNFGA